MRVELRCASREVEGARAAAREVGAYGLGGFGRHGLGARGPGIHVAMQARLVAHVPQVHLHRVERSAVERGKIRVVEERKGCVHRGALWCGEKTGTASRPRWMKPF